MPLSLLVDVKVTAIVRNSGGRSSIYALVSMIHPDWLIRSNFRLHVSDNKPFPSSPQYLFQGESKCEIFILVISFNFNMNEN